MGLHPKIGITGLPRSGKSAVMSKVLDMIADERVRELRMRGGDPNTLITAGLRMEPILEGSERQGYKIIDIVTGDEGIIAHRSNDDRLRVLGLGLDLAELERVAIPALRRAREESEVIVIDEIGPGEGLLDSGGIEIPLKPAGKGGMAQFPAGIPGQAITCGQSAPMTEVAKI